MNAMIKVAVNRISMIQMKIQKKKVIVKAMILLMMKNNFQQ